MMRWYDTPRFILLFNTWSILKETIAAAASPYYCDCILDCVVTIVISCLLCTPHAPRLLLLHYYCTKYYYYLLLLLLLYRAYCRCCTSFYYYTQGGIKRGIIQLIVSLLTSLYCLICSGNDVHAVFVRLYDVSRQQQRISKQTESKQQQQQRISREQRDKTRCERLLFPCLNYYCPIILWLDYFTMTHSNLLFLLFT